MFCFFFLGLVCVSPGASGISSPPVAPASEKPSDSWGRLGALPGLKLRGREAMSSRAFGDGVTVLVEWRTGVLGQSTARAGCEPVSGTDGSAWVGGSVAGDTGVGGSPNLSRAAGP